MNEHERLLKAAQDLGRLEIISVIVPPKRLTMFCRTCNARDRIIIGGVCDICHQHPEATPRPE